MIKRSRRDFIRKSGGAAFGAALLASGIERFSLVNSLAAAAPEDYKALVCVFLSGGNDGNNMIVPLDTVGYNAYSAVRNASGLAIASDALLPITPPSLGTPFGLHPNLTGLRDLFTAQRLAVVANVGPLVQPLTRTQYRNGAPKPYQLFSHSDQVTQALTSVANTRTQTGWGGRASDRMRSLNGDIGFPLTTSVAGNSIFGIGTTTRSLIISPAPTALNSVLVLSGFGSNADEVARRTAMSNLRALDTANTLVRTASETVQEAIDISQALATDPTLTTVFPTTTLGNQLKQVAKVMKLNQSSAQLGLSRQIFFCSLGGFDTHQNQPGDQGNLFTQVSQAMKAFYDATVELGLAQKVTTFTLSDFGRTLQPSGSGTGVGTDHGWGNHLMVMGDAVRGGDFYGVPGPNGTVFPTLQLGGPDDTDSRGRWIPTASVDQYAATLANWFGLPPMDQPYVFPLLGNFTSPNLGFMM